MTTPAAGLAPPAFPPTASVPPQARRPQAPMRVEPAVIAGVRTGVEREGRSALAAFWAHVDTAGTPLVEPVDGDPGHVVLTWLWRGGDELADVVLDANKVVDPADISTAQLERVPGTDVWFLGLRLGAGWRGSYAVAAVPAAGGAATVTDVELADMEQRRAWVTQVADPASVVSWQRWFDALRFRRPDPRARQQLDRSWSVAAGPAAPPQPFAGHRADVVPGSLRDHRLAGPAGDELRLWSYRPPGATGTEEVPLLVVLDGDHWLGLGVTGTFDRLIADGAVPPFAAVLVASRPTAGRVDDLTCNPRYVAHLADVVVPQARRWTGSERHCAVAGKSLGGLTALYALLARPDVFDGAISLSGSFWWPNTGDPATREWLTAQVAGGAGTPGRVHLEVGLQEWVLLEPTRRMAAALAGRGAELRRREFDGGHDPACWRGGLADGIAWALRPRAMTGRG